MKKILLGLFVLSSIFLFSCGGGSETKKDDGKKEEKLSGDINIDGSSTVFPISEAVAEEFKIQFGEDVNIKVSESGTGGGFKKFIRKEIDITDASRPVKKSEDSSLKAGGIEYIELPIAYDGLAVVVNPANTWVDKLTVAELKKIWEPSAQKKIVKWSQIRNGWPDIPITLFGAGTASGTFDYFTEAVVGKAKESRGDYNSNENDNMLVTGVAGDKGALGYFGLYYYLVNTNKLKIVPIDDENDSNGKGAIIPSEQTVKDGTYQPLSRPLFIYISKASAVRPEVDKFVQFYIGNADALVKDSKYIPLTKEIYDLVKKRYDKKVVGSVFLNLESTVGIKLDDLLKKE